MKEDSKDTVKVAGETGEKNLDALINLTTIVYALQALSFLFGVTFLAAVIINYVKKDEVAGTWLESHFRWQIYTFWYALIFMVIGLITALIFIGYLVLLAGAIWVIYRIVVGWLALQDRKPMYQEKA